MHKVARLVEAHERPEDVSSNPTEGDRIWGGRVDMDLSTHLSMGLGGEDQAKAATLVEAHVKSFRNFRKRHKRLGTYTEASVGADRSRDGAKQVLGSLQRLLLRLHIPLYSHRWFSNRRKGGLTCSTTRHEQRRTDASLLGTAAGMRQKEAFGDLHNHENDRKHTPTKHTQKHDTYTNMQHATEILHNSYTKNTSGFVWKP